MTQASDDAGNASNDGTGAMQTPPVVSGAEWDAAHARVHERENPYGWWVWHDNREAEPDTE